MAAVWDSLNFNVGRARRWGSCVIWGGSLLDFESALSSDWLGCVHSQFWLHDSSDESDYAFVFC